MASLQPGPTCKRYGAADASVCDDVGLHYRLYDGPLIRRSKCMVNYVSYGSRGDTATVCEYYPTHDYRDFGNVGEEIADEDAAPLPARWTLRPQVPPYRTEGPYNGPHGGSYLRLDCEAQPLHSVRWSSGTGRIGRVRVRLTLAGQVFERVARVTAWGMADPLQVSVAGRRYLVDGMRYGQVYNPPQCAPRKRTYGMASVCAVAGFCIGRRWMPDDDIAPTTSCNAAVASCAA